MDYGVLEATCEEYRTMDVARLAIIAADESHPYYLIAHQCLAFLVETAQTDVRNDNGGLDNEGRDGPGLGPGPYR